MLIEAVLVLSRPGSAGVSQRAVEGCVTIRLSAPSFSFTFFYYLSCVFNIVCSPCPSSHTSTTSRVCSRYLGSAYSHARVGLALKQVKIKYSHLFLLACLHPPFPFFSFPPPPVLSQILKSSTVLVTNLPFPRFQASFLLLFLFFSLPSHSFLVAAPTHPTLVSRSLQYLSVDTLLDPGSLALSRLSLAAGCACMRACVRDSLATAAHPLPSSLIFRDGFCTSLLRKGG